MTHSSSRRLDEFQRSHPSVGFPIAVLYKFADDQGPYLAALITYYGFLSLFPLLLLLASVLGFVLQRDPGLQRSILDSTLSQFPVIGEQLGEPQGLRGSVIGLVIGGLVALYGALGVAQALQNAMNVAWSVPRRHRPNAIRARLRSLSLIVLGGLAVLATTVLSALASSGRFGAELGPARAPVTAAVAMTVNGAVLLAAFRICTNAPVPLRSLVPGAVLATVVWQLLQWFGTSYIGRVVTRSDPAYGVFGFVLGLLAWLFLAAGGIVVGSEVNAVMAKRLYPRALMTLFTDDVELTSADRRIYAEAAKAQQFKADQTVDVRFTTSPGEEREPSTTLRLQLTFDAHDPAALSAFWRDAVGDVDPMLLFRRVPEGAAARYRVHLDVRASRGVPGIDRPATLEAECERLEALGAVRLRRDESPLETGPIVMADPEGNEFCLV